MARSNVPIVANRWLLRRVARPVVALVGVVVAGVAGFVYVGGVGLVDAAFWLLDPSSIALYYQTRSGPVERVKTFAIVVRVALVAALLWTGETALTAAFGGQIREELKRVKNQRERASVDDHVVICGYGMFGQTVAERARARDRDVVVVESDPAQYERVLDDGFLGVEGDARHEGVLADAGVERASSLVAAIDDSNANIQIALLATQLAPDLTVVVRVGDETYESVARHAGADEVIIPEVAGGEQVVDRW
ncbi:TrkA-N domain-containing protein [Haloplanus vescus]|uniref:TrkA-N domain-containing protein n=1 Tax=Haloplanus vescus TaxID=555874 RepID=A0A1H3YNE2_9EURY|nr:NAD(P)-binding protein [Haloplanus vescus]SEA12578.1 TrkA-N domain-containing protein [Haloplanus vescus]